MGCAVAQAEVIKVIVVDSDGAPVPEVVVFVSSLTKSELTFALEKKLRTPHQEHVQAVQWSEY